MFGNLKLSAGFVIRALAVGLLILYAQHRTAAADKAPAPRLAAEYLNILTTYACYAKTLWHDAPAGGYWGDGLDAKNANGAVRGTCNTLLVYSMVLHAGDNDWLPSGDRRALESAGLNRDGLLRYIRANLSYLIAHHRTGPAKLKPRWGHHWQSSLWVGALAPAALLSWNELSEELQTGLRRVVADEADWVGSKPPKDMHPGDTGAEENGWNTAAPAAALALYPDATSATLWWKTLTGFAVNTYSRKEDKQSTETVDGDRIAEIVTTANVSDDLSMINHGFFHPDYAQVSGQHLGEAWMILKLGDGLHGLNAADRFDPYARHNVKAVWETVMRPLLMPSGEFLFPSGNDWTYHCSTNQSYFAFIASFFQDPDAALAEERGLVHVRNRRSAGPPGRLLGDSNLEWWWEPLVSKRCTTALLMHMTNRTASDSAGASLDNMVTSTSLADARAAVWRNESYIVSASWGKPRMINFVPFNSEDHELYLTVPQKNGLFPSDLQKAPVSMEWRSFDNEDSTAFDAMIIKAASIDEMTTAAPGAMSIVCLQHSVVLAGTGEFGPLWIENDSLTMPGRMIRGQNAGYKAVALEPAPQFAIAPKWVNADDKLTLIGTGKFIYRPAGRWNYKSVAADVLIPDPEVRILQLTAGSASSAADISRLWQENTRDNTTVITLKDGAKGDRYRLSFRGGVIEAVQALKWDL